MFIKFELLFWDYLFQYLFIILDMSGKTNMESKRNLIAPYVDDMINGVRPGWRKILFSPKLFGS